MNVRPGHAARVPLGAALLLMLALPAAAQPTDFSKVEIKVQPVAPNIYMLTGAGGNIGVSAGEDGVFVIDDQFAPLTDKILAALAQIHPQPPRFVVNTHWHGDHTGGNENLGKAGAVIVAHENVRRRMSTEQFLKAFNQTVPPAPKAALPIVTFADAVTFHLNGDEIHSLHVPPAHTDSDAVIHFRKADVLHTGDLFFNGVFPFIDVQNGGTLDGLIAAIERLLGLCSERTRIIPGHGPLADKAALVAYRDMLVGVRAAVAPLVKKNRTLEQVKAAKPLAAFDARWGQAFIKTDTMVEIAYESLRATLGKRR